jgi:hypothetical protein
MEDLELEGETAACVAWGAFLHSKRVDLLLYTLVN